MEIATERAMGCERVGTTLRLHISKDERVDFELVQDEETGQLRVGEITARETAE